MQPCAISHGGMQANFLINSTRQHFSLRIKLLAQPVVLKWNMTQCALAQAMRKLAQRFTLPGLLMLSICCGLMLSICSGRG